MPTVTRFCDRNEPYASLVSDLARGKITERDFCHLAPDISRGALHRTGRRDSIYTSVGYANDGSEALISLHDGYHASERARAADRSGVNALVFDPFWYWGGIGVIAPDNIAGWAHDHIGQSVFSVPRWCLAYVHPP